AGARVLVDAAQSVGQRNVNIEDWNADFVAGTGHKWLLGPWGAGFVYVAEPAELESPRIGYRGVEDANAASYEYVDNARRLELATTSAATYAGLAEAVETMRGLGLDAVEERIARLTDRLKDGLERSDATLLSPRNYESGLVSFDVADPEKTVERLAENGVKVRTLPYPNVVRASVHAFNTAEDIDALLTYL
ncbi:MAG: aminotransferase class V-fold PLP-dependent enzyme, partial [Halobacteria archaeon]|nr:aminotransferase class V-fold PLP-dependent enzyme [Halobacteria archaeon]